MMTARRLATALVVALALTPAARAEDAPPLTPKTLLTQADGTEAAYACFTRRYDNAHLAGHPKQNVRTMALFVSKDDQGGGQVYYNLSIRVTFRAAKGAFDLGGSCRPDPDHPGKMSCGFECDGGHMAVRTRDATSILVDIPDGAGSVEMDEAGKNARFGEDDKLFRLDKAVARDCAPIIWDDALKSRIMKGK